MKEILTRQGREEDVEETDSLDTSEMLETF
jgi:hypothetical protein